jgi:flagellar biosynthesis protein FlhF
MNADLTRPGTDDPTEIRTYRGRRIEEILPQIRAELGPDAIILREREGLVGGVGGFFAQRCIEIEARPGEGWTPRIDVYDDEDDDFVLEDEAFARPLEDEAFAQQLEDAAFAHRLEDAVKTGLGALEEAVNGGLGSPAELEDGDDVAVASLVAHDVEPDATVAAEPPAPAAAEPRARPKSPRRRTRTPRKGTAIAGELTAVGASKTWTRELIAQAAAHGSPLAPHNDLRAAVRTALARTLVPVPPLPVDGAVIAFVGAGGAGKTHCTAALAAAYRRASTLPVTVIALGSRDEGRELAALLESAEVPVEPYATAAEAAARVEEARHGGMVIVDTAAPAPTDASVGELAAELGLLPVDATFAVIPAPLGAPAARRLLTSLAPLQPAGIAVAHVDETDQLGVAVELAATTETPIAYLHEGVDLGALSAADPDLLASRLIR